MLVIGGAAASSGPVANHDIAGRICAVQMLAGRPGHEKSALGVACSSRHLTFIGDEPSDSIKRTGPQ
jgi:hypothetical protein